jgi:hypothetical protein
MSEDERVTNEAQAPFQRAYEEFRDAVQAAWSTDEARARGDAAYREFVRAATDAMFKGDTGAYITACLDHGNRMREAMLPDETRDEIGSAYAAFVAATRDAFANADPTSLTPALLGAIGRGLLEVSSIAHRN